MSGEDRRPGQGSSHSHGGGRRPVKVWNAARNVRKALVVGTYDEFLRKGRDKLCVGAGELVRVVLETDGTQVEDGEYFQTLPENTIFIVLRGGEVWAPAGEDIVSQVVSTIPKIVCETLAALGLQEEIPSWKIMDNKGKITVVLHWEKEHPPGQPPALQVGPGSGGGGGGSGGVSRVTSRQSSTSSTIAAGGGRVGLLGVNTRGASQRSTPCLSRDNSHSQQASSNHTDSGGPAVASHRRETVVSSDQGGQGGQVYRGGPAPLVTVINADEPAGANNKQMTAGPFLGCRAIISGAPSPRQLSRQGSSIESSTVHTHTVECTGSQGARLHQPLSQHSRGSPTSAECDFHCCSLHGGSGAPAVNNNHNHNNHNNHTHKTVATSPVQAEDNKRTLPKGAHVRFDVETHGGAGAAPTNKCEAIIETGGDLDTSESDGEVEGEEGDSATSSKFLLLVDQLSVDQKHHLSIKDIGIILDRLSSKIVDVEKLSRDKEESDIYNWTIKATIRGDVMRELGVIYNSNYYSISEHPSYLQELPSSPSPGEDKNG